MTRRSPTTWHTVIALHCSGASGRQWDQLEVSLPQRFAVVAPDFIGCGSTAAWDGRHAFSLADEAAPVLEVIDTWAGPVHLVGHS